MDVVKYKDTAPLGFCLSESPLTIRLTSVPIASISERSLSHYAEAMSSPLDDGGAYGWHNSVEMDRTDPSLGVGYSAGNKSGSSLEEDCSEMFETFLRDRQGAGGTV
jgi:hypothetical protein